MDGQEYLNQISATTRPTKNSGIGNIFSSKIFIFGIIAIVLLIAFVIVGAILSSNKTDVKTLAGSLKVHLDNTTEVINSTQTYVKSSSLRSSSASLAGILSNTNNQLTNYLTEQYKFKVKDVNPKIVSQLTLEKDALSNDLFTARINGNLDRIYAHKMSYEISKIIAEENRIINFPSNSEELQNILVTSRDSLLNLFDSFNNFSETK